jgi:hypothetical protein
MKKYFKLIEIDSELLQGFGYNCFCKGQNYDEGRLITVRSHYNGKVTFFEKVPSIF